MKKLSGFIAGALFVAGVMLPASSHAAYITTLDGNDCSGEFGQPFDACAIPELYDPNQSPVIAKYDVDEDNWQINSLFPSVTGGDFDIDFDNQSWTYMPEGDDPLITFWVIKQGNEFHLFSHDGSNTDSWAADFPDLTTFSHITFYDSDGGGGDVPEPTTLALLGLGLLGAGIARRRR